MEAGPRSLFAPGTLVGRYRLLKAAGTGGMAEVYLAEDTILGRRVAVKIPPSAYGSTAERRSRFVREARTVASFSHPNLASVYDVGEFDGSLYLVGEYIDGSTVSHLLKGGPTALEQAVEWVAQAADGLACAHEAGIVHRDIKPANLMVGNDGRLRVLDFGLAQPDPVTERDSDASLTEDGLVVGTPPYMSPEQAMGRPLDARSDIFSLGVVLYEMLLGRKPFQGDSSVDVMHAIAHDPPGPLGPSNPPLPLEIHAVLNRALQKSLELRTPTMRDFAAELRRAVRGTPSQPAPLTSASDTLKLPMLSGGGTRLSSLARRPELLALALVALISLGFAGRALFQRRSLPEAAPAARSIAASALSVQSRRSVAVLGFKNLSSRSESAWISDALAEMLGMELAAGGKLRTIPGESVTRMKKELALPEAESFALDTLTRVRTRLGAELVVLGSYFAAGREGGDKVRLDLRVQDGSTGETVTSVTENGTESELAELVTRTGVRVRENLGVERLSSREATEVRESLPSSGRAARLYAGGLAKLGLFDGLGARALLEEAAAAQPGSPLIHAALSEAWAFLGYEAKASAEAQRAFELSERLSREERLSIEGRYREATKDWRKGIEIYRALWSFFPDNVEYGLRLAEVQTAAGQAKEALSTTDALQKLPPPISEDPRIDLAEARAAGTLFNLKRRRDAGLRAGEKARRLGARFLVPPAQLHEAWALAGLGDPKRAAEVCERARLGFAQARDQRGVASALVCTGNALKQVGELDGARRSYEESLAIYRSLGNKSGEAWRLLNLAGILQLTGSAEEAARRYGESLLLFREMADRGGEAQALLGSASLLGVSGRPEEARKRYEEALAVFMSSGDQNGVARVRISMASLMARQGSLPLAETMFEEAAATARSTGNRSYLASSLLGLGEIRLARGDLPGSRLRNQEALTLRNDLGEKMGVAECWNAMAKLSLEEGRTGDAETLSRQAADQFHAEKRPEGEGVSLVLLARSLLMQGRTPEAWTAVERALPLAAAGAGCDSLLAADSAAARVEAKQGKVAEAVRRLESSLARTGRCASAGETLEARLVLGEIRMKSDRDAGRTYLAVLASEAQAGGYGLVARKAAAVRSAGAV